MKKIIFFVSSLVKVGPTNQLYYIMKYLDRNKVEPLIVTLFDESDNTMIDKFLDSDIKVISLKTTKLKALLLEHKRIQSLMKKINPDVIHSQGLLADSIVFHHLRNYKSITTVRNYPHEDYPNLFPPVFAYIFAKYHLSILKKMNVVSCSNTIQKKLSKHNISSIAIQNSIDVSNVNQDKTHSDLKKELNISKNAKIFIVAGSLIRRKNIETIINAFNALETKNCLLIAGDGNLKEELKKINQSDKKIIFLGNVSNIDAYYSIADCFISASYSEGLPNAVLEALLFDLPCILSSISSHKEIFKTDMKGIDFFDPDNVDSLRSILSNYHFCQKDGIRHKYVEEHFNAKKMSENYQNTYMEICND